MHAVLVTAKSQGGLQSGQSVCRCKGHMVHHLCQFSHESMSTAAERNDIALAVTHVCHQCVDCLLIDGRVDEVAKLAKLLP